MMPAAAMRDDQRDAVAAWTTTSAPRFPCIGHERADLVVAGCAILEAIMDIWPAETLGVADRGIREGILRSLMARDGHEIVSRAGGGGRASRGSRPPRAARSARRAGSSGS